MRRGRTRSSRYIGGASVMHRPSRCAGNATYATATATATKASSVSYTQPRVRVFERASRVLEVVRPLFECFRVPFAARRREEVSAVHVNRGGDALERIGDGVD